MGKYVENNLNEGEQIVLPVKKSFWCILPEVLTMIFWIAIFVTAKILIKEKCELTFEEQREYYERYNRVWQNPLGKIYDEFNLIYNLVMWLVILINAFIVTMKVLKVYLSDLAITDKRVIGKVGLIKVDVINSNIDQVSNVFYTVGFWGTIFRYCTLVVEGVGTKRRVRVDAVTNPEDFKNAIVDARKLQAEEAKRRRDELVAKAMGEPIVKEETQNQQIESANIEETLVNEVENSASEITNSQEVTQQVNEDESISEVEISSEEETITQQTEEEQN